MAEDECAGVSKMKKDSLHSDVCCVCLGKYEDDGRDWLQCKCIHEDCVDYDDTSSSGALCPLC